MPHSIRHHPVVMALSIPQQMHALWGWQTMYNVISQSLTCSFARCLSSTWLMVRWLSLGASSSMLFKVNSRR